MLKTLKDIDLQFDRATYKAQVAELMSTLAEAKVSLLDTREELREKDSEIADLKRTSEFTRDGTVIHRGMRYQRAPYACLLRSIRPTSLDGWVELLRNSSNIRAA